MIEGEDIYIIVNTHGMIVAEFLHCGCDDFSVRKIVIDRHIIRFFYSDRA